MTQTHLRSYTRCNRGHLSKAAPLSSRDFSSQYGSSTGALGIVIGTLALIGVFLSLLFGILDFRQALWVVVAIAGIAAAPTIVAAIWTT